MNDLNLTSAEETLFVTIRERVYASKNFPEVLNDKKALGYMYHCHCGIGK